MASLIEDYALIGDMQTAALVSREGSVDWLCLPRFDSDACFAALLGDERNGRWRIARRCATDQCAAAGRRRYRGDTLILETTWTPASGAVRVTDFMPPRDSDPAWCGIVEGAAGTVEMDSCCAALRLRPGRALDAHGDGSRAIAGPDCCLLATPVAAYGREHGDTATSPSRPASGCRSCSPGSRRTWPPDPVDPRGGAPDDRAVLADWAARCTYRAATATRWSAR